MREDFKIAALVAGFLGIIILFVVSGDSLGFDSAFTTDFISLLPGITVFIVGAATISFLDSALFVLVGFSGLGVGMAIIVDELNTAGVLIPEIISSSFTLNDLKIATILVFVILGAIASSFKD